MGIKENNELKRPAEIVQLISNDIGNEDIVQKSIGALGRWQIWLSLAIFMVKIPVAWHQLSIVFLAPPTDFSCMENTTDKCSPNCSSHIFDRSIFTKTIISQWDLVCEKAYLANLAQSVTMSGILLGNILFGYFADKFGRRNPLICAVILQVVSGTSAAYIPWFIGFLIMRFLCALATGGTMVTSFVLLMELVGPKWRMEFSMAYQFYFTLGHVSLPLMSYFIRDWTHLQIAISLLSSILISYYWILPESPRWLLTVDKKDMAVEILEKASRFNKLPVENIKDNVYNYAKTKCLTNDKQNNGNILYLVKTPTMRMYTFCMGFNWLVCGFCFFGIAQYVGQLGGNIFINVALSAIIQGPSTLFSIWSLKAWGRKYSLIFAHIVSGLSCIAIGFTPAEYFWIKSALSCIGLFGLAISFPTVYIYTGELFPTMVRNVAIGSASMSARFGSMAAPFVAGFVNVLLWLPPIIFGILPFLAAIACYRLPETLNCKLPDTIEEAEELLKNRSKYGGVYEHNKQ